MTHRIVTANTVASSLVLTIAALLIPSADAAVDGSIVNQPQAETAAGHDARMACWREARFGMFIH